MNTPEYQEHEAIPLEFVIGTQNSLECFAQVVVPHGDTDVESLGPKDYELNFFFLGKSTWDASRLMVTVGIKEIMKNMGEDEMEIQEL